MPIKLEIGIFVSYVHVSAYFHRKSH